MERSVRSPQLEDQDVVPGWRLLHDRAARRQHQQRTPDQTPRHGRDCRRRRGAGQARAWLQPPERLTTAGVGQLRRLLLSALPKLLISRATSVMRPTGRSMRPAITQPASTDAGNSTASDTSDVVRS